MVTLEVIATSVDDCQAAQAGGADRIELCSALPLGGLTPSLGLLIWARAATEREIMVMLRPRAGGFAYSEADFAVMCADAEIYLRHGADGIVFGCLHPDGTVDRERTRRLVALAGSKQTVFHRAFDVTPDPYAALDILMQLGVTRVLSSGQHSNALDGAANLAAWRAYADRSTSGGLQLLPGGGVTVGNVRDILRLTGADQVHASLSGTAHDPSTAANRGIRFGAAAIPPEDQVRITDGALVAAMRRQIDREID
jgi:copper homeostasis protein